MKDLNYLNRHFLYKRDGKIDNWQLMRENTHGNLIGDCEDYSLWVAYYTLSNASWMKLFWNTLTRKIKFNFVRVRESNIGHTILENDDKFIDNNFQRWVSVNDMTSVYNFKWRIPLPVIMWMLLVGKVIKTFNR